MLTYLLFGDSLDLCQVCHACNICRSHVWCRKFLWLLRPQELLLVSMQSFWSSVMLVVDQPPWSSAELHRLLLALRLTTDTWKVELCFVSSLSSSPCCGLQLQRTPREGPYVLGRGILTMMYFAVCYSSIMNRSHRDERQMNSSVYATTVLVPCLHCSNWFYW